MESLANKGVSESGNVALELIVAVALTVTFVVPAAINISSVYQSRLEMTESFSAVSRTFQKSPQEDLLENMQNVKMFLQRGSNYGLRIFFQYTNNVEGEIDKVEVRTVIDPNVLGMAKIDESVTVERAPFVS